MKFIRSLLLRRLRHAAPLAVLAAGAWIGQSWAAGGTLADAPLFTSSAEQIKPNIMFILDNSGSMDWTYTPVAAGNFGDKQYGKYAPQCNGLAFDPDQEYPIPVDHKGNAKPTPTFDVGNPANDTESQKDVKGTVTMPKVDDTITVELDSAGRTSYQEGIVVTVFKDKSTYFVGTVVSYSKPNVKIKVTGILPVNGNGSSMGSKTKLGKGEPKGVTYYAYEGKQPRLGYKYDGGVLDTGNAFYKECASEIGKGDGAKVFVAKTVTAVSPEAQKYANWSTYYRSRMSVMKAAISFAFKDLGDRYRVGYATINDYTDTDNFLDIKDFAYNNATDKGHKKDFYTKFWSAEPNGGTPLRGALSRAGQYFANKMPGQQSDPIEYSCQRNFTILSTDGYWNSKDGVESASYGPFKLDNKTKVGQQDGTLKRPMRDGASVTTDTEERWEQTIVKYINYETPTTTTTGKQTVTRKRVAQQRSRKTYSQGGSHSCGFLQSKWIETTENMNVLRERTDTTISQRQVTVSKKLEPVKITEVWNVVRTVKDVDGVPFPADEQRTLKSRTEVANGEATTDPGTPQSLPPDTQTTWKDLGTESLASSTAGKCYSWFSSPSNTGWDDIGSPVETVLGTSGPTDVNKVEGPGARALAAAPTSQEVVDGTKTVKETSTSSGGQENTLADVAAYYYQTDLRTDDLKNCTNPKGVNVCDNNVPGSSSTDAYRSYGDSASWQHMTTFTLGLGVNGVLDYDPAYLTASSGHFHEIVTGQRNWPAAKEAGGSESWPGNVDDLWHAAVNGRGQYFNANDPTALTRSLTSTLEAIKAVTGSASAASTSSLQPVAGDNDVYLAQFTSVEWTGDVLAFTIHPTTGAISTTATWSAKTKLDARTEARSIWYAKPGGGMEEFTWANLKAAGLDGKFDGFCSKLMANGSPPDQCASLGTDDKAEANKGSNLVDFLRGNQSLTYYRARASRLGDIINASPLYVGRPRFLYEENGYQSFASGPAKDRTQIVLAASNDGMLHAFNRKDGKELWAFIPSFVLDKLPRLADIGYSGKHQYLVDGSPVMGDVFVKDSDGVMRWKTIVVGGLNKGGRGYYALDVTDTEDPKLLWEFTHDNLGYTYGNPIITKRADGTWVVVFASGYDNVGPGDGNGHLFVVDAWKGGTPLKTVSTFTDTNYLMPAGTTSNYSGLAKINSWVESDLVNTSKRFYGGDLLGNLWRFDIDDLLAPKSKALLLAQLKHANGTPQPITTRPALAEVKYNGAGYPVVYVATGAYLREGDPTDTTVQSVYAIKDPLTATGYGDLRKDSTFVEQEIEAGLDADKRPTREQEVLVPVRWNEHSGWRADFPVGGERVSVNPQIALDTLYVGSNLPKNDACTVGGDSFLYRFDILTGKVRANYVGNVLLMGVTTVQLTTGANASSMETIVTTSKGELKPFVEPPSIGGGTLKRTSWRELVD